ISYLYVSSDEKTAIAEVRPWRQADISVGYFEILNDQRIVDLTKDQREWIIPYAFGKSPTLEELEESIWAYINGTFSQPVSPQDQPLHYIPSQYLAEVFKLHRFDGVGYRSSLNNNGFNIVLFNPKCAKLRYCQVFRVDDIEYKFSKSGSPFSCKE
ncbi:MAG: RES family NAD+ phosphorylase, partial [bacterium]